MMNWRHRIFSIEISSSCLLEKPRIVSTDTSKTRKDKDNMADVVFASILIKTRVRVIFCINSKESD